MKKEVMFCMELDSRFGSGNIYKGKRVSAFIIDENVIQLVVSISGYGSV